MNKNNKNLTWIILLFSLIGFSDAFYLTIKHYQGASVVCLMIQGCDRVTASVYSTIAGIPVALLGVFYYFLILLLAVSYLRNRNEKRFKKLMWVSLAGFLASLWFVYLQIFVIKAICIYCMVSAFTSIATFLLFLILTSKKYEKLFGVNTR